MEWFIVFIWAAGSLSAGDKVPSVTHSTYGSFESKEACEAALVAKTTSKNTLSRTQQNGDLLRATTFNGQVVFYAQCLSSRPTK